MKAWVILVLLTACIGLTASISHADTQATPDTSREGDGGRILLVPGGWTYLGDVAYPITHLDNSFPWNDIQGLLSLQTFSPDAWFKGSLGIRRHAPALMFQGTVCPIPGLALVLPAGGLGDVNLLNFPVGAWWGPSCGVGVVQLQTPPMEARSSKGTESWVSGSNFGFGGSASWGWGAAGGVWNRVKHPDGSWNDRPSFDASTTSKLSEHWDLGGSALYLRDVETLWDVLEGSIRWKSGGFQELRCTPFVQRAKVGIGDATETGVRLEHRFNLAGIFETHLGAGFSDLSYSDIPASDAGNRGYLQGGFFADALGWLNLDCMVRVDVREGTHGLSSAQAGIKVPFGDLTCEATLSDSAWREDVGWIGAAVDSRTGAQSLGVAYTQGPSATIRLRALHEKAGADMVYGLAPEITGEGKMGKSTPFRSVVYKVAGDWRKDTDASGDSSTGAVGKLDLVFDGGWNLWGLERVEKNRPSAVQIGVAWIRKGLKLNLQVDNAADRDVPWPNAYLTPGRIVRGSAGYSW